VRVAAYLDLNPVRAGLVEDPKDYRWCGYAAALKGNRLMRNSMTQLFEGELSSEEALASYRLVLCGKDRFDDAEDTPDLRELSAEKLAEELKTGGNVSPHQLLRMRVRYFTDGMVLGSKAFIEFVFLEHPGLFGLRRLSAGTALSGGAWGNLHVMRNLKKTVYLDPR
jgi:hypothetical protein